MTKARVYPLFSVRPRKGLKERIAKVAIKADRSKNWVVNWCLEHGLPKLEAHHKGNPNGR